jgi:N-acetyl-anhydromuramyl-L-alanine amidase AmpD
MNLKKSIMEKNPCYTSGRKIEVRGLMLHSVGCPQPSASAFINNWNSPSYGSACVHAFIDGNDGTVYQTLPWNHRGWHCGAGNNGSANNTHIGVEMCEPATISYVGGATFTVKNKADAQAVAKRTYKAAAEESPPIMVTLSIYGSSLSCHIPWIPSEMQL